MKNAFSMIEIIFAIVIIGILSAIAVPRFSGIVEDTNIEKGRTELVSIRSGITRLKQDNLLQGKNEYPDLNGSAGSGLFGGVTSNKIESDTANGWSMVTKNQKYKFKVGDKEATFSYDKTTGMFDCNISKTNEKEFCKELNN